MQMMPAIAIAMMLVSAAADAQTGKTMPIKVKAPVVDPSVKPAPEVLQHQRIVIPQPKPDAGKAAYSDLVDNVAESLDQFRKDNTSKGEERDRLDSVYPEDPTDDAGSKVSGSKEAKPLR